MGQLSYCSMLIFPMYSAACNEAYKLNVSSPGTWSRSSLFDACSTRIAAKWNAHSNNEVPLHAEGKSTLSALYTRHRPQFNVPKLPVLKHRKNRDLLMLTDVLLECVNCENTQQQTITNPTTVVIVIITNEKHPRTAVYMRRKLTRKVAGWKNSSCCVISRKDLE